MATPEYNRVALEKAWHDAHVDLFESRLQRAVKEGSVHATREQLSQFIDTLDAYTGDGPGESYDTFMARFGEMVDSQASDTDAFPAWMAYEEVLSGMAGYRLAYYAYENYLVDTGTDPVFDENGQYDVPASFMEALKSDRGAAFEYLAMYEDESQVSRFYRELAIANPDIDPGVIEYNLDLAMRSPANTQRWAEERYRIVASAVKDTYGVDLGEAPSYLVDLMGRVEDQPGEYIQEAAQEAEDTFRARMFTSGQATNVGAKAIAKEATDALVDFTRERAYGAFNPYALQTLTAAGYELPEGCGKRFGNEMDHGLFEAKEFDEKAYVKLREADVPVPRAYLSAFAKDELDRGNLSITEHPQLVDMLLHDDPADFNTPEKLDLLGAYLGSFKARLSMAEKGFVGGTVDSFMDRARNEVEYDLDSFVPGDPDDEVDLPFREREIETPDGMVPNIPFYGHLEQSRSTIRVQLDALAAEASPEVMAVLDHIARDVNAMARDARNDFALAMAAQKNIQAGLQAEIDNMMPTVLTVGEGDEVEREGMEGVPAAPVVGVAQAVSTETESGEKTSKERLVEVAEELPVEANVDDIIATVAERYHLTYDDPQRVQRTVGAALKYGIEVDESYIEELRSPEVSIELASGFLRAELGLNPQIEGGVVERPASLRQAVFANSLRDKGYDVPDSFDDLVSRECISTMEASLVLEGAKQAGAGNQYQGPADSVKVFGREYVNDNGHAHASTQVQPTVDAAEAIKGLAGDGFIARNGEDGTYLYGVTDEGTAYVNYPNGKMRTQVSNTEAARLARDVEQGYAVVLGDDVEDTRMAARMSQVKMRAYMLDHRSEAALAEAKRTVERAMPVAAEPVAEPEVEAEPVVETEAVIEAPQVAPEPISEPETVAEVAEGVEVENEPQERSQDVSEPVVEPFGVEVPEDENERPFEMPTPFGVSEESYGDRGLEDAPSL